LAEASSYSTDSVRFLGGRSSPIIVATILISLGWTLLVVRTESYDFAGATQVIVASEVAADAAERAAEAADADGGSETATAAADEAAEAGNEAAEATARSTGEPVPTTTESTDEGGVSATESAADAAASAEEAAAAKDEVALPFFQLLVPTPSAATMAFLGAYFFGVYLVLGGYFRGDLRPKIYNQITARLVTVVVVAYLINALLWDPGQSNRVLLAAAFLAGVVPNTVLQRLGIFATGTVFGISTGARSGSSPRPKGWLRRSFADAFGAPRALTQIDGIDIYESARLASEGVADVPSLARSDLVPMMINTRLPVERLVDWTDKAVLVALLDGGPDETPDRRVVKLRSMGIRTASDLRAVDGADEMDGTRRDVERILSEGGPEGGRDGEALLRWLADRIVAEPSFHRIQRWRASELADIDEDCPTLTVRAGDCDEIPGDGDRREAPGDGEDAGKNGTKRVRRGPNGARRSRP
jgi:hypothetical protein